MEHKATFSLRFLLAACALGACLTSVLPAADVAAGVSESVAAKSTRQLKQGMWVWDPRIILNVEEQDKLLDFAQSRGMNLLLVETHWDPDRPDKDAFLLASPDLYVRLIREAGKRGIKIEALSGWRDWAYKTKWAKPLGMVDSILDFNRAQPPESRFVGIHLDIEPYLLPEWKSETRFQIMQEHLELMDVIRQKLKDAKSDMTLAVDIPMWLDRRISPENTVVVEYKGVTKNYHQHLQDVTDYVGIMSYVRRGTGPGSIQVAIQAELDYARSLNKYVMGGMETKQLLKEPEATFFGLPPERFLKEKAAVEEALRNDPAFGGILVHQYPAMKKLLETPATQPGE